MGEFSFYCLVLAVAFFLFAGQPDFHDVVLYTLSDGAVPLPSPEPVSITKGN